MLRTALGITALAASAALLFLAFPRDGRPAAPSHIFLAGHPEGKFRVPLTPGKKRSAKLDHKIRQNSKQKILVMAHVHPGQVHHVRKEFDATMRKTLFLPDHTFAIWADEQTRKDLENHDQVKWLGHMRPEWKHSPRIFRDAEKNSHPVRKDIDVHHFAISVVAGDAPEIAEQWSVEFKANFHAATDETILVHLTLPRARNVLGRVREDERVHWIELRTAIKFHNFGGAEAAQAGRSAPQPTKIWDMGIDGSNEVVHIHDSGIDKFHCMFSDTNASPLQDCTDCDMSNFYRINLNPARSVQDLTKKSVCSKDWWNSYFLLSSYYCKDPNQNDCFESVSSTRTNIDNFNNMLDTIIGEGKLSANDAKDKLCPEYERDANGFSCKLVNGTNLSLFEHAWRSTAAIVGLPARAACESSNTALDYQRNSVSGSCIMRSDVCKTPQNDQRKLKAHWSYADSRSLEAGHGTHVSGSVAGLVPSEGHPMNKYKGMAFNASIVFSDASNGEGGSVYTPPAINDLWRWGKNMGASISTNSWGDSSNVYSTTSRDMDDFVYDNPEHLILFAAGNAGSGGYGTLGSQANAKNVITVGAASQPQDYQLRSPLNVTRQWNRWMMVQALCNPTPSTQLFQILNDMIRERCGSESDKLFATAAAMNSYYCDTVGDRAQIVDDNWRDFVCNVRTVDGKNCPDKIRDDILKNLIPVMLPEGMTIQVDDACGNNAENALQREVDNGEIGEYYMADFSSRGPTADNRIKPDLVAPGKSVVSAGAATDDESKTCRDQTSFGNQDPRTATGDASPFPGLVDMSGTSMATPLTAGAAALVRQYYREGFAKAGVKDTSAGVVPSAALMKATLIASTIPVQGKVEIETNTGSGCSSNEPCKEYKDANSKTDFVFHYGFGHIQLANALSFQGDSHKLHFAEGSVAEKTMTCYNITFGESTSRGDVRVVLVWTDPFGQPSSSKMLVNDLDLRLHDGDTTVLGNAENKGSNCRDYLNNVESLKRNAAGINSTWTIAVDPALLNVFNANGGQDYALVVVAPNTTEFSAVECPAIKNFQSYECEAGSGGSSDDQLSDEEIAAIVICSVIGFTAIAGVAFGVWWLCCYKDPTKEQKQQRQQEQPSAAPHAEEFKREDASIGDVPVAQPVGIEMDNRPVI